MEDKKCRICGFADLANPNIFQSNSKLAEKIVAVYPIVLYPNDPLPKHICKKCLLTTSTMYADIERFVRNQNKWIANVRSVQPTHNYIKVVDSIEGANRQTAKIVSLVAGDELGERTICNLFNFNIKTQDNAVTSNKPQSNIKHDSVEYSEKSLPSLHNVKQDGEQVSVPVSENSVQNPPNGAPSKITQIKSALELNGCTLTKLKLPTKSTAEPETNTVEVKVEIKEEPISPEEFSDQSVSCKMCWFHCESVEELAIHQLKHLTLSVPKLNVRRFLDKRIRRGRLIKLSEKKCIRCLNCWRIFVDNKSILHHWSTGDCDFFCQVCGKEFATNPKMLREHVPAAHGISYKSSKLVLKPMLAPKQIFLTEKSPKKSELSPNKGVKGNVSNESLSVKVACNICLKVFANFKARNSHMRAHKNPPLLPPQLPPSLSDTLMALNRNHLMDVKKEPQDYDNIPYHIVTTPLANSKVIPHTAPLGSHHSHFLLSTKNIPERPQKPVFRVTSPAKIRTKYVQFRPGPKSITFKSEPKSTSPVVKVKSLIDLQDPSVSSQQPEDPDKLSLRMITSAGPQGNRTPTSNGLPGTTPKDSMNYGQIFNCHPCRGKFSSKLELFRHKRKCTANNLYPCQFCSRHFLTSADLQMHIMLLHKNSSPQ